MVIKYTQGVLYHYSNVIREQAINWAYVDADLCSHMASPSHNEFKIYFVNLMFNHRNGS